MRIGLISDTHGLLRPQALDVLRGCDALIHAGDIGAPQILDALRELAPLTVVRGNNDGADWARSIAATEFVRYGTLDLYVLHDLADLDLDPRAAGIGVVVSGHSHRPGIAWRDGVLYLNPGSAGPRRFKLPVTVAELRLDDAGVVPRVIELDLS